MPTATYKVMDAKELGLIFKQRRMSLGLTLDQLKAMTGIAKSTFINLERGNGQIRYVFRYANMLGLNIHYN